MKKIINLTDIQELSKEEQVLITGSAKPHTPCGGPNGRGRINSRYCDPTW